MSIKDLNEFQLFMVFATFGLVVLSISSFSEKYLTIQRDMKMLDCITQTHNEQMCKGAVIP